MDFRNIINVTIPAGRVNKISIGGVVYWNKAISAGNKYKIMKNDVQVAEVTMSRLVKQVNSGVAQERYGIGAQIIIPYTDPFNNTGYELPFNFGTFTAYGEGKLGIQAHYAVPSILFLTYGKEESATENNCFCEWNNSYAYRWLNAYGTEHEITAGRWYPNSIGFLGCIPQDFSDVMLPTLHGNAEETTVQSKIFLLGAVNTYMLLNIYKTSNYMDITYATKGDGEDCVWEYWRDRISTESPISLHEVNSGLKVPSLANVEYSIFMPNKVKRMGSNNFTEILRIDTDAKVFSSINCRYEGFFLPATVIG